MTDVRCQTRNEAILSLISDGWLSLQSLSHIFDCPEASIRRSIGELRDRDYFIVVKEGMVACYGARSPLISCEQEECRYNE